MYHSYNMVLNPYKSNDSRSRIIDPYYNTNSSSVGLHRSFLVGWFSTRNMIILLLVCIPLVSYIFHIHHNIAVDPKNDSEITLSKSKLRGATSKSINNQQKNNPLEGIISSPIPTWKPTFAPSYMPTPRPTSLEPSLSPTTLTPTLAPTTSPIATEKPTIAQTVVDLGKDFISTMPANHGPPLANKDTMILSLGTDQNKKFFTVKESGSKIDEPSSMLTSITDIVLTKSLLHSMKNHPSLQQQHQPPSPKSYSLHSEKKTQIFPSRHPSEIPQTSGNLQVSTNKATTSDGMIRFDPSLFKNSSLIKDDHDSEDLETRDLTKENVGDALLQSPNRMKYDLPAIIKQPIDIKQSDSSIAPKENIDHCKSQIDPFQSQPVESFVPPANAPFSKVLEWQTEVKNVLKNIGKMRIGGDKLRLYMQEEVNRLRVNRFNAFCEYVE